MISIVQYIRLSRPSYKPLCHSTILVFWCCQFYILFSSSPQYLQIYFGLYPGGESPEVHLWTITNSWCEGSSCGDSNVGDNMSVRGRTIEAVYGCFQTLNPNKSHREICCHSTFQDSNITYSPRNCYMRVSSWFEINNILFPHFKNGCSANLSFLRQGAL